MSPVLSSASLMAARTPPQALAASRRDDLLTRLGLTVERSISDDGDSFVTLLCRESSGARVVLKYVSTTSPDAFRRLHNEARVLSAVSATGPLRLLTVQEASRDYLVTAFDPGVLLRAGTISQPEIVSLTVAALLRFQQSAIDAAALGICDRERASTYYLKVLTKHIAHLWPALLTAGEALQCVRVVRGALPAIGRTAVPCHGDFMPTNLLYDAAAGTITFTDLEGFMTANHPLFDVVSLLTVSDRALSEWVWQRQFLREYFAGAAAVGVDVKAPELREAYRGILTFFLVYRFNEARLLAAATTYFDGVGKGAYLARKARDLMLRPSRWRPPASGPDLSVYAANLRVALNDQAFADHWRSLLSNVPA